MIKTIYNIMTMIKIISPARPQHKFKFYANFCNIKHEIIGKKGFSLHINI